MALQNTDNFLVNRGGSSYKAPFSDVRAPADAAQSTANTARTEAAAAQSTADAALPKTGGNMTGGVSHTERTISSSSFDLSQGNMWVCGAITVPNPTNATAGQSGLIRITAGPVVWGLNFKFPGGAAPTLAAFPAIIPYYVQNGTTILMGSATQGIA